jgi:hypothetical protein
MITAFSADPNAGNANKRINTKIPDDRNFLTITDNPFFPYFYNLEHYITNFYYFSIKIEFRYVV